MWHALAEFVDNSTQSRENYDGTIDSVLREEGHPLQIDIVRDTVNKELRIVDNSIGMTKDDLIEALKIANPTADSKGRSKYGMGLKTAACWLGRTWRIVTCEWGSGEEWTATVDIDAIANRGAHVPLTMRRVSTDEHYTKIIIGDLRRNMQARTEETIKEYLGSMYMFDLIPTDDKVPVKITFNGDEIRPPNEAVWATDPSGKPYVRELPANLTFGGKSVAGYFGILEKGGRKLGGFSLYQNGRQIQGFPNAWKPKSIFGGVDDEGANNLVAQRLTGVLLLDPKFAVSHTKDAILYEGDEETDLEHWLMVNTKDFRDVALKRRTLKPHLWNADKMKEMLGSLKGELVNDEMRDALSASHLPPIETIIANNQQIVGSLLPGERVAEFPVDSSLTIILSVQNKSDWEPYVTIAPGAEPGVIHVIVNGLHPYYHSLESDVAVEECCSQFLYDAVAEHKVSRSSSKVVLPESVRRIKDALLRVRMHRNESENYQVQKRAAEDLERDAGVSN